MATLLISYDLDKPETSPEYLGLIEEIRALGPWAKVLSSGLWLVKSDLGPVEIRDKLGTSLGKPSERLIVIDISGRSAAWQGLPNDVSEWIRQRI